MIKDFEILNNIMKGMIEYSYTPEKIHQFETS